MITTDLVCIRCVTWMLVVSIGYVGCKYRFVNYVICVYVDDGEGDYKKRKTYRWRSSG